MAIVGLLRRNFIVLDIILGIEIMAVKSSLLILALALLTTTNTVQDGKCNRRDVKLFRKVLGKCVRVGSSAMVLGADSDSDGCVTQKR